MRDQNSYLENEKKPHKNFFQKIYSPFKRFSHYLDAKRGFLFKRSKPEKVIFGIVFVLFLLYAASLLYPLVWLTVNSLMDSFEYNSNVQNLDPFALPTKLVWGNYAEVLNNLDDSVSFPLMFLNGMWYSVISAFLCVFMPATVAYCLSKFQFPGRDVIYGVAIFSMTIPIIGNMGAQFKFEVDIGIYDTIFHVIITNLGGLGGFYFLVMYGFFRNISSAYAEAVYIDGGGEFVVYFRVMLPQASPILLMLMIMSFIGGWNDYMTPILYLPSFPTVASGMYLVSNTLQRTGRSPIYFAGLVISMIPVLILFAAFGNKMMNSVSIGGLKG